MLSLIASLTPRIVFVQIRIKPDAHLTTSIYKQIRQELCVENRIYLCEGLFRGFSPSEIHMTHFTQDEIKAALASVADGSRDHCTERNEQGIFHHLYTKKYITGIRYGLNGFQMSNLALSQEGHQILRA